jgi:hypothetical protein
MHTWDHIPEPFCGKFRASWSGSRSSAGSASAISASLLCEDCPYQNIEHEASEGRNDDSGNLEAGAVEVS